VNFKRVEQRLKALQHQSAQTQITVTERTVRQGLGLAALDADEVVLVPLQWCIDRFSTLQQAAAHGSRLHQQFEIPVHGGEPTGWQLSPQSLMELLRAQLMVGLAQELKQAALP